MSSDKTGAEAGDVLLLLLKQLFVEGMAVLVTKIGTPCDRT